MTPADVLAELDRLGTAQNRKVYGRHGVSEPLSGVSYANLRKLASRLKTDHALALALWQSGNHDARVLATMIADPTALTVRTIDAWARDLDNYVLTDALADLVARSPQAGRTMRRWTGARGEWKGRVGWALVARLAMQADALSDAACREYLTAAVREIHQRKNRVRDAMNSAVIAIGLRSPTLQKRALAAAGEIGTVDVDHGETGCKTPDAASYICKAAARKRGKAARA